MTDDYRFDNNFYGHIVNVEDQENYVQGNVDDPLVMFRGLDHLLECEEENMKEHFGEKVLER